MKSVMIAGATGYLGRHLCAHFRQQGWHVTALVRATSNVKSVSADKLLIADVIRPNTLKDTMQGIDLLVSALGITSQKDGLDYWDVDYQGNVNLLDEAVRSGVARFAYVHVLNAKLMSDVPLVAAKLAFVQKLQSAPIQSTVIAPSGFFSDMGDFLEMARKGRVWLFGDGQHRINPIHGADLAEAIYDAALEGQSWLDIGGPETFSHEELAHLCFSILETRAAITFVPDFVRRIALRILPVVASRSTAGPAQFFLSALGIDMTAKAAGSRRLSAFLMSCEKRPQVREAL